MKRRINQYFLLGLCLYARQVQLSIDRSFGVEWNELVDFFQSRTHPDVVAAKLSEYFDNELGGDQLDMTAPPSRTSRLSLARIFNVPSLSKSDAEYIYLKLGQFSKHLSLNNPSRAELAKFRMDMASIEGCISAKISPFTVVKQNVEHFNQNPILNCKSINALIGSAWPNT